MSSNVLSAHVDILPIGGAPSFVASFCRASYIAASETNKRNFLTNVSNCDGNSFNNVSQAIRFSDCSFEVRNLAGTRTVLRKGRQKHCWHVADPHAAEMVLAGIDVPAVRS